MCISRLNSFKESFPKDHRPEITELEEFWEDRVSALFRKFAEYILKHYDLRFGIPVWSEKGGWTYRIGKSGVYLVTGIRIEKNGFIIGEIVVRDENGYGLCLEYVRTVYEQNQYTFQKKIAEKNARQAERNRVRMNRERNELAAIRELIIPEKYNVFSWPAKLDLQKLNRLYMQDAKGIWDETLADEIGLTLYLRCKYGKEDAERMEHCIIRCHHCGGDIKGDGDFRQCTCGYQYSYREYRRSFHKNNMPAGAASKAFEAFMAGWNLARTYNEKMILIDILLHEFHLSLVSGAVHRSVAVNFIDGTRKKIEYIINGLAVKK